MECPPTGQGDKRLVKREYRSKEGIPVLHKREYREFIHKVLRSPDPMLSRDKGTCHLQMSIEGRNRNVGFRLEPSGYPE